MQTGLTAGPAHQGELLKGQQKESTLQLLFVVVVFVLFCFFLLYLWQTHGLTKLKSKVSLDWSMNTQDPNTAQTRKKEPLQMTELKGKNYPR